MTEMERFMAQVLPEPNSGCWLWVGHGSGNGYGGFWRSDLKQQVRAHRWIYEQVFGSFDKALCVCHKCDNRMCVNPHHLFVGTQSDNLLDCSRKGRLYKGGANNPCRKGANVPWTRIVTHCKLGHPLTGICSKDENGKLVSQRRCTICQNESRRKYKDTQRAKRQQADI